MIDYQITDVADHSVMKLDILDLISNMPSKVAFLKRNTRLAHINKSTKHFSFSLMYQLPLLPDSNI